MSDYKDEPTAGTVSWVLEMIRDTRTQTEAERDCMDKAIKAVNQPERPHGKWTHDGSKWKYRFLCSECGYKLMGEEPTNFCPNCGADMRGDDND